MTAKAYQAKRPVSLLLGGGTANRLVTTLDGTTLAMAQASASMLGPGAAPRGATKIVAAVGASAAMIAQSDYQCDGVADEVQINAALAALPAGIGGTVLLSEGTFTLAAPVNLAAVRQRLRGMGMGATILVVVNAAGAGVNTNTGVVNLGADYTEVSDLTIDGNKANNAAQTNMRGITTTGLASPLIERVRVVNSVMYGMVLGPGGPVPNNAVIRDCLSEGSGGVGFYLRATAGQPTVVSGCTAKGVGSVGFACDNGPVVLSDCQAISAGGGFSVTAADISLSECTALSNTGAGFSVSGARAVLSGCRASGNAGGGFVTTGAQTQFLGCVAVAASANGHGFLSDTGATDAFYSGCVAQDALNPYAGFLHASTGRSTYVGCQALNPVAYGFRATNGEVAIRDSYVYGTTGSHGISLIGGAKHVVDGCRVTNNGGYGILVETGIDDVALTNNSVSNSSLATANTYPHIRALGSRSFIVGNVMRDPPSGNRPPYGLHWTGNDPFVGVNDAAGAGTTGEYNNGGTRNRQPAIVMLDYFTSADVLPAGTLTAGVWLDVIPDQTFRVNAPTNLVEITCWGAMIAGALSVPSVVATQIVIDAATTPITRFLGAEHLETTTYYQNPLTGAAPIKLSGLAVGNHTVKLQVRSTGANGGAYLRAATFPNAESIRIQVVEYAR